jgi:hypothetical protein
MVNETLGLNSILKQMITKEDFSAFSYNESLEFYEDTSWQVNNSKFWAPEYLYKMSLRYAVMWNGDGIQNTHNALCFKYTGRNF